MWLKLATLTQRVLVVAIVLSLWRLHSCQADRVTRDLAAENDDHICERNVTRYKWRPKPNGGLGNGVYTVKRVVQKVCCVGYSSDKALPCQTNCANGCVYSAPCHEPQKYVCPGCFMPYNVAKGDCKADCLDVCKHGCLEPDVCTCNAGYHYAPPLERCLPNCPPSLHCLCDAPGQCRICDAGYHPDGAGRCLVDCPQWCLAQHGHCRVANTCTCNEKYHVDPSTGLCAPDCRASLHCRCSLPHSCIACHSGYRTEGGACVPDCPAQCPHSCARSDKCNSTCAPGYHDEAYTCVPTCASHQQHCACVEPGVCVCHNGYARRGGGGGNDTCTKEGRTKGMGRAADEQTGVLGNPGFIVGMCLFATIGGGSLVWGVVLCWRRSREELPPQLRWRFQEPT